VATVMMCPAHGRADGDSCGVTGCFEPLHPVVEDSPAAVEATCLAAGCGMPMPCPLHPAGSADAGHREVVAHLAACAEPTSSRTNTELGGVVGAQLHFPWGPVTVPADGMTVGRDFGVECGTQIQAFDNVSRAHARLSLQAGQLVVVDLNSTNGTTVNGDRLPPDQPSPVGDGDVLGFGNRLRGTVSTRGVWS
jgi:FHA domain